MQRIANPLGKPHCRFESDSRLRYHQTNLNKKGITTVIPFFRIWRNMKTCSTCKFFSDNVCRKDFHITTKDKTCGEYIYTLNVDPEFENIFSSLQDVKEKFEILKSNPSSSDLISLADQGLIQELLDNVLIAEELLQVTKTQLQNIN